MIVLHNMETAGLAIGSLPNRYRTVLANKILKRVGWDFILLALNEK